MKLTKCYSSFAALAAKRLEGKVAVITGGASGLGESTARLFAKHGAKVVIADIQDDLGRALCEDIRYKDSLSYVHCDVTVDSDVHCAVDTAMAKYGKLDIMFSNAGIFGAPNPKILETDYEDFKKVMNVNVLGSFLCAKHAARVMIPARKGSILFTSSTVSVFGGIAPDPYTVSKHAVVGLAKNLCVKMGQHGIRVNCISPYVIYTPLVKQAFGMAEKEMAEVIKLSAVLKGGMLEANDVAEAAVYLGSDESKYVSGLNLTVDGGFTTTNLAFAEALKSLS